MGKNKLKLASNIVRHRAEIKLQAPHAIDATSSPRIRLLDGNP